MKKILTFSLLVLSSSLFTLKAQSGIITTIGGNGTAGYAGDTRQATAAELNQPNGVAVDATGNVYIADTPNNRIRKISTAGIITTIAGTGVSGYNGDGGQATAAQISFPQIVRVDSLGNIYFSDNGNNIVRKINAAGRISTIAGNVNFPAGYTGDGGQATAAELNSPVGISVDKNLNVYFTDQVNNVVRKVATTGIITTVAGNHLAGYTGDGGPATNAKLNQPLGVAVDNDGRMYICDYLNNVIRLVNTSGTISTFAGNGTNSFNNFSGPATSVEFSNPTGISVDDKGHVYLADAGNAVIWEAFVSTNQIYVIAGIVADGYSGDGGAATLAEVNYAFDAVPDKNNNIFIADLLNNRIRKITAGCAGDSVVTADLNNPECNGFTDGYIEAFPSSNFAPYSYLWSDGNTTSKDTAVPAGTYTIAVKDAFGCTGTGTVTVTQPPAIVVNTSNYTICLGNDVKLVSSASGGTGNLTYIWDIGNTTDTVTVNPNAPTTYTIYVQDGIGCVDSALSNVTVNPLPNVILNAEKYTVCSSVSVDTLFGSPAGGTYTGTAVTGNIFNPNLAGVGTYTLTYTYKDTAGCTGIGTQVITVSICSGIQQLPDGGKFAIYPNPANNEFTIQMASSDDAQMLSIYSVTGQLMYQHQYAPNENSQMATINSQAYPSGVYFVKVLLRDGSTLIQKVDIAK